MKLLACLLLCQLAQEALGSCGSSSSAWMYPLDDSNYYFMTAPDFKLPSEFTIETWFKPYSISNDRTFLSWAVDSSSEGSNCITLEADVFPEENVWQYFVLTWDGTSMKVYVDGLLVTTGADACDSGCPFYDPYETCAYRSGISDIQHGSLVFTQDQDSLGGGFQGSQNTGGEQDSIAIYSRAWAASEVKEGKNFVDLNDPALYAAWVDDTGTDASGNGNAATINKYELVTGTTGCPPTAAPYPVPVPAPVPAPSRFPVSSPTPEPSSQSAPVCLLDCPGWVAAGGDVCAVTNACAADCTQEVWDAIAAEVAKVGCGDSGGSGGSAGGYCFRGDSKVELRNKVTAKAKRMPVAKLRQGDTIRAVDDATGKLVWRDVANVSSSPARVSSDYVEIKMHKYPNMVVATKYHTFPTCSSSMSTGQADKKGKRQQKKSNLRKTQAAGAETTKAAAASKQARQVEPGDCLRTEDGEGTVESVRFVKASKKDSTYTVQMEGAVSKILVGGIVTHAKSSNK